MKTLRKKFITLLTIILMLTSCQSELHGEAPVVTATSQPGSPVPVQAEPGWGIYDADPEHLWNRVFRQFYQRNGRDGADYGSDELDPLLWFDTTYLLEGPSHERAIEVLDEFLNTRAEASIREPLKRAMFQRDLWAVFDWLASPADHYPVEREALKRRIVEIMKRVALPRDQILSLPDNYALAVESKSYPAAFQSDHRETAFLPPDLFQPESAWVPMGRKGGPVAMTHTEAFPFFARSVFLVLVRSPEGRVATLDFLRSLSSRANPVTASGTQVALVRRMLLIDDQGEMVLSPLVETIQIRHFSPIQHFYEFELDRKRLFGGTSGGLTPNGDLFMLFMGHGDVFEVSELPALQARIPEICKACHFEDPSMLPAGNTKSIISYSRHPFQLPDNDRPDLLATTVTDEAQTAIEWKMKHVTWKALQRLWQQNSP